MDLYVCRSKPRSELICFIRQIRDTDSALTVAQLLFLEAEDSSKPIHLYINSPGGSVTAGLAIYDTVRVLFCHTAVLTFQRCRFESPLV